MKRWLKMSVVHVQAAQRAIKNKALSYLSALKDPKVTADLLQRMRSATNMTDQISALACLVDSESELHRSKCFPYTCVAQSLCMTWSCIAGTALADHQINLMMGPTLLCRSGEGDSACRVL